ncbi:hypothetical protein SAMN05421831_11060 [Allopseudospirillum japonicum]|uniref:Nitrogen fixation protein FixH n=1 Tax=Allopseudospirillum japonicum TaxID=64971 RepID=A0A1H6TFQ5_9GAMM|nr:FixH family protein [Allopseudospirillum japonicum]SEI78858.1 hypothetical protein SAMN05421831_11060 [Allopseudospirillum japonicum]
MNTPPWYKQFWPWLILAPLIVSVLVGTTMLIMSIRYFDGTVRDDYYKSGLAINQELEKDVIAQQLELKASLRFDSLTGDVVLDLQGQLEQMPTTLKLALEFPTRADRDLEITLNHQNGSRYVGALADRLNNRWYIQLQPPSEQWRLQGVVRFPSEDAVILSASTQ